MMEHVVTKITQYFKEHGKILDLTADILAVNYIQQNVLDSISFVRMIVYLETEFNITFTQQEISDPNFQTISGIANVIKNKFPESAEGC